MDPNQDPTKDSMPADASPEQENAEPGHYDEDGDNAEHYNGAISSALAEQRVSRKRA